MLSCYLEQYYSKERKPMKVIYKYPIQYNSEKNIIYVKLPKGAYVISALDLSMDLLQGFVYAVVDPDLEPTIEREVLWLGTGIPLTKEQEEKVERWYYLGTHRDGPFVWHIWIEPEYLEFDWLYDPIHFGVNIDSETNEIKHIKH